MASNNNFGFNLQGVLAHTQGLLDIMRTGEGLGLSDADKEKFKEGIKAKGTDQALEEELQKLKATIQKANGDAHKVQ